MTRNILSDEDKAVENAKWGLGIAAVVGMLFVDVVFYLLNFLFFFIFRRTLHGKKTLKEMIDRKTLSINIYYVD